MPGAMIGGADNVSWSSNFCKHEFKSPYYRFKGYLLALPYGISSCNAVSNSLMSKMEKEDHVALGKVVAASKTKQNEDPLYFLKKPSRLCLNLDGMRVRLILIQQERGHLQVVQWT